VAGDSDHDQIYFDEDQCPNKRYDPPLKRFEAWAIAKYGRGCPVPDADKDGVPDAKDACPGAKHTPLHTVWDDWRQKRKGFGCVEADADKDGVPDEHDKCPATSAGNFMQVDPKTGCMPATN
jgi:OOP family OmpA-OmpF porin